MANEQNINDSVTGKYADSNLVDDIRKSNRDQLVPMHKAIKKSSGLFEPHRKTGEDPVVDKFRAIEGETLDLDFHGKKLERLAKELDMDVLSTAKAVVSNPEEHSESIFKASKAVVNGSLRPRVDAAEDETSGFDKLLGLWDRYVASGAGIQLP